MRNLKHILIVLGCAQKRDGKPSERMISLMRKTVQLYKKNNYSAVILSGGPNKYKVPEAAVMRVMLMNYIPHERLMVETRSKTLVQNALFCWEKLKGADVKSVTVVASRFALHRAEHVFRKLYAHMRINLKFEGAQDNLDPVESAAFWLRERLIMIYYKMFGF